MSTATRTFSGLLGTKFGMTQFWGEGNKLVPVTVIQVTPNVVTQIRTLEKDGYEAVQIAAGAIERPLVFPGNDRPGVMLADAARTYAVRYRAAPGQRAVIATTSDTAYRAALDLQACGVEVALVADARPTADGPLPAAARAARASLSHGGGHGAVREVCDLLLAHGR